MMDFTNKIDTFFMDKEEREARKKVNLMQMRSEYNSAAEDATKASKRTAEAYLELKKTAGNDAELAKLVEANAKYLVCPF